MRTPVVGETIQIRIALRTLERVYTPARRWDAWVAAIVLSVSDSSIEALAFLPSFNEYDTQPQTREVVRRADHCAAEHAPVGAWRRTSEAIV